MAEQRRLKHQELLAATQAELEALAASVARPGGPPEKAADIGVRAGKIINHYKMSKHFSLTIRDGHLEWARKTDHIKNEELLDGIYVVRTSEPTERLAADDGVRSYKRLALVEQAFRCVKGIDLLVRPIHHRTADRVRAHILLCLLAFYVEWHLRQVWEPLLFEDAELTEDRRRRDPWHPPKLRNRRTSRRRRTERQAICRCRAFETLMAHLGTRCRNSCVVAGDPRQTTFFQVTDADARAGGSAAVDQDVARNRKLNLT